MRRFMPAGLRAGRSITFIAVLTLALPATVVAQDWNRAAVANVNFAQRDSVLNGLAIGGALGAVGGFIIAPYVFCGTGFDDTECTTIVRAVIGLPILAGGLIAGGLIDRYHVRGPVIWSDKRGMKIARVGTFPGGGQGMQMVLRF